jgi:hypothetical protein
MLMPILAGVLVSLFVLLAAVNLPAFAQGDPCAEDVQRRCRDVPRSGRLMACLRQHRAALAPACAEHLQARQAWVQAIRQACQSEVQRWCQDVKPGRGALAKCLRAHDSELTAACRDALGQARAMPRSPR